MNITDSTLPQSIRNLLLKTVYPLITTYPPGCSADLLLLLAAESIPANVSLFLLNIFGNGVNVVLSGSDVEWIKTHISKYPELFAVFSKKMELM